MILPPDVAEVQFDLRKLEVGDMESNRSDQDFR